MKIGVLIPTRGDREKFLEHSKRQVEMQSVHPEFMIVVDHEPESEKPDITQRVRIGYEKLTEMGADIVVIIEDDDAYHPDYLKLVSGLFEGGADLIGFNNTIYYHLGARKYKKLLHNTHSSLFQTSIRAGLDIRWPYDDEVFLDIELWRNKHLKRELHQVETGCIGIKHGVGKTGGRGHNPEFYKGMADNKTLFDDPSMEFLKAATGDQFGFYQSILV